MRQTGRKNLRDLCRKKTSPCLKARGLKILCRRITCKSVHLIFPRFNLIDYRMPKLSEWDKGSNQLMLHDWIRDRGTLRKHTETYPKASSFYFSLYNWFRDYRSINKSNHRIKQDFYVLSKMITKYL